MAPTKRIDDAEEVVALSQRQAMQEEERWELPAKLRENEWWQEKYETARAGRTRFGLSSLQATTSTARLPRPVGGLPLDPFP
ncbi:hypothetical protein SCUP515_03388 [Seiridium cupressi]